MKKKTLEEMVTLLSEIDVEHIPPQFIKKVMLTELSGETYEISIEDYIAINESSESMIDLGIGSLDIQLKQKKIMKYIDSVMKVIFKNIDLEK